MRRFSVLVILGLMVAGCTQPASTTTTDSASTTAASTTASSAPAGTPSASSEKGMTAFGIVSPAATGSVAGSAISVSLPYQTALTSLVATFTTTGASVRVGSVIQESGTTANDFTNPVTYTVTAVDGSTAQYVVTVTPRTPVLSIVSGNAQTGIAGTAVAHAFVVQVADGTTPIPDVTVSWTAIDDASVTARTSVTDRTGQAQMTGFLGQMGGTYTYSASAKGATGSPVTFTAKGATTIVASSGTPQEGAAGAMLPNPLVAKVTDSEGNPIPGITVSWEAAAGGGSVGVSSAVTDANGIAMTTATLGPEQRTANTFSATVTGLAGTISFTATSN